MKPWPILLVLVTGCAVPKVKPVAVWPDYPPYPPLPIDEFIGPLQEYKPVLRNHPVHFNLVGIWITLPP